MMDASPPAIGVSCGVWMVPHHLDLVVPRAVADLVAPRVAHRLEVLLDGNASLHLRVHPGRPFVASRVVLGAEDQVGIAHTLAGKVVEGERRLEVRLVQSPKLERPKRVHGVATVLVARRHELREVP